MPFIVDKTMRASCVDALRKIDNEIYFSCEHQRVYYPVNTHPDTQIHFVNENTAFVPPELFGYYRSILPENIKLNKGNKNLGRTYPSDVAYNISRIGNNVILNEKYADDEIVKYYIQNGFKIINVKQGYVKCNICTDGALAVTEDNGVYNALLKNGIAVITIPAGEVALPKFHYGFIGGASGGKDNKVFLCGTMKNREIFKQISDFFSKNGSEIITLDKEDLTDYGSIIYFE